MLTPIIALFLSACSPSTPVAEEAAGDAAPAPQALAAPASNKKPTNDRAERAPKDGKSGKSGSSGEPGSVTTSGDKPVILFGIGVHIEPAGLTNQGTPDKNAKRSYSSGQYFTRHAEAIDELASLVERFDGKLTVQSEDPFSTTLVQQKHPLFKDLIADGHELGLHFHDANHLGRSASTLPVQVWCDELKRQMALIKQGGGGDVRYLSGGAAYEDVAAAMECAGLEWLSDFKQPGEQTTPNQVMGVNPWRPGSGPVANIDAFAKHDPSNTMVFLPNGLFEANNAGASDRKEIYGGEDGYLDFVSRSLQLSLDVSSPDRVNVFHITVHPGEFGDKANGGYPAIERFLTNTIKPLVDSGQVQWATYSEMGDAWLAWEKAAGSQEPRGEDSKK